MAPAFTIGFVILTWWFSTGLVLWLATRSGGHPYLRLAFIAFLGLSGSAGIIASGAQLLWPGPALNAFIAFLSAIAIWGAIEFSFLTGMITGSNKTACPPEVTERERFRLAFDAVSHHEYALVAGLIGVGLLSTIGNNSTAFGTFAVLWLLRVSAKLTLFSGVPRFSIDLMPKKIAFLQSYFRRDRIGPAFWISTSLSTITFLAATVVLVQGFVPSQSRDG